MPRYRSMTVTKIQVTDNAIVINLYFATLNNVKGSNISWPFTPITQVERYSFILSGQNETTAEFSISQQITKLAQHTGRGSIAQTPFKRPITIWRSKNNSKWSIVTKTLHVLFEILHWNFKPRHLPAHLFASASENGRLIRQKHSIWHSAKKFNKAVFSTTITYEKLVHNLRVSSSFSDGISFVQLLQSKVSLPTVVATVSLVFTSSLVVVLTRIASCSEEFWFGFVSPMSGSRASVVSELKNRRQKKKLHNDRHLQVQLLTVFSQISFAQNEHY